MYTHDFEPYLNIIDFFIDEIKEIKFEKQNLIEKINMLERENMLLKERIACYHVEESKSNKFS